MIKPLPALGSDAEAEEFVDAADLTQYNLSEMQRVRLQLDAKDETATKPQ
jgi:hypothetical protein